MESRLLDFIQRNSPDGGFLQSGYWRKFQEAYGRKTFTLEEKDEEENIIAYANMITHTLPIVGNYFYLPRGPIIRISNFQFSVSNKIPNPKSQIINFLEDLISLAKKESIGWIRIEPNSEENLKLIEENLPVGLKIKKSAVDVQPMEILILDITKSEEELLAQTKQKTRYNIRLAEKRGVRVSHNMPARFESRSESGGEHGTRNKNHTEEFLRLVKITAKRDRITSHPKEYYRKMFEIIPADILKLYVAEYKGKIICANIVSFFGKIATYMHGASDNFHREIMAPYLLQWQAILDAKKMGCTKYDLGGINTKYKNWEGITRFKTGFAPNVKPIQFPGCWDIVLDSKRYLLYRVLQRIKRMFQFR